MQSIGWLTGSLLLVLTLVARADDSMLTFPDTSDGRRVLAVDLHTHSAFSDGRVWPSLRIEEAERDGLSALAVTEHLEWQPNAHDLPHPDRNRPYEIARQRAAKGDVVVINGAEISRGPGIGHINAVFIQDANRLMPGGKPSASTGEDLQTRFQGNDEAMQAEALDAVREARSQGAFIFLNHPAWTGQSPDGRGRLSTFQRELIAQGLLDGVEVGNSGHYSIDAHRMALDHDLAILGTSDVHGLIAWDYADEDDILVPGSRGARTVTLLLSSGDDLESIRGALDSRQTVALNDNQLFGRADQLQRLVEGALVFSVGEQKPSYAGESSVYELHFHNRSPIPLQVRNVSSVVFADNSNFLTVPPRGVVTVYAAQLAEPDALQEMQLEILNAFTAPDTHLEVTIRR